MALSSKLQCMDGTVVITLSGVLDASTAEAFHDDVKCAVTGQVKRLVLMVSELEYMASAGLRVLAFARQKMAEDADIYIIGAQQPVLNSLQQTGIGRSCPSVVI